MSIYSVVQSTLTATEMSHYNCLLQCVLCKTTPLQNHNYCTELNIFHLLFKNVIRDGFQ